MKNIINTLLWLPLALTLPFIFLGRLLRLPKRPLLRLDLWYMKWRITEEAKSYGRSFEETLEQVRPVKVAYEMMKKESGYY